MKNIFKLLLVAIAAMFLFACESDEASDDFATINVSNLSNNPAIVWIHAQGNNSNVTVTVPANTTESVEINDGNAGLDVFGGKAIIEYSHQIHFVQADQITETFVFLDPDNPASVSIDNDLCMLDIESYSTTGEMWVSIDYADYETIPVFGNLVKFYDPYGASVTKVIDYNGYTIYAGTTYSTIYEDDYDVVNLNPDAACVWIENTSNVYYITNVYISPASSSSWGDDQLGYDTIDPGYYYTWTCQPGVWDIKVIDDYDDEFIMWDVSLDIDDIFIYSYDGFRTMDKEDVDNDQLKAQHAVDAPVFEGTPLCQPNRVPAPIINR